MFNSKFIGLSLSINNNNYRNDCPIIKAIKDFYFSIVTMQIEMWQDMSGSKKDFIELFEYDYPIGFVRRNYDEAVSILYDLKYIAESNVIRYELSPLFTFVIYHLVIDTFDLLDGDISQVLDLSKLKNI